MPSNALSGRTTSSKRTTRAAAPALFVVGAAPRHGGTSPLPLDDRSCPRREVAILGEVDSGYRWDEA